MSENLNKAIAYCMHALKRADGADKGELKRAMLYVNSARNMVQAGDQTLAHTLLGKAVEILKALEPVSEGIFSRKTAEVPLDRLKRVVATADTTPQERNAWLGQGRRVAPSAPEETPASRAPQAPTASAKPVFGKRKR